MTQNSNSNQQGYFEQGQHDPQFPNYNNQQGDYVDYAHSNDANAYHPQEEGAMYPEAEYYSDHHDQNGNYFQDGHQDFAGYGQYDSYDGNNDHGAKKTHGGGFLRLVWIVFIILLFSFVVFGVLLEVGKIPALEKYRPSRLLGLQSKTTTSQTNTNNNNNNSNQQVSVANYDECEQKGGTVNNDYIPTCFIQDTYYYDSLTKAEMDEINSSRVKSGEIVLEPSNKKQFSKFVVGPDYTNLQKGLVAYSANNNSSSSAFAYMIINNTNLPDAVSNKDAINNVSSYLQGNYDYNTSPYLFKAFEIGQRVSSETFLIKNIDGVDYKNVDSSKSVLALDGEGQTAQLVIRIFAKKGDNIILLEENFNTKDSENNYNKYYKDCVTTNATDAKKAKECYAQQLNADAEAMSLAKGMADKLASSFALGQ